MNGENGFLYLNAGNEWPSFLLDAHLAVAADGSMGLKGGPGAVHERGVFRGGPFEAPSGSPWFRLKVDADALPEGTHLQMFTFTADGGDAPFDPAAAQPFSDPGWCAAPRDILELLVLNPPATRLWVGGILRSDGLGSPVLRQMRAGHGRDTYLQFLPAIYREPDASRDFLERFLSLPESVLGAVDGAVDDLPRLFDPFAAPAEGFPSWLGWLAGWLDFALNEHWTEAQAREYLSQAFELYGKRGTLAGLQRYLKLYAGVEARIVESGSTTSLWSLGETSSLGFTTMLVPGDWQGAVLGTTATLDRSHLVGADACGAALFEDVAHRFCVRIYCAELTRPGALEDARAVIEREKPAHTDYHLCVVEPRLLVGSQARVGIDAIVAGGPPRVQLGRRLDEAVLGDAPEPCQIGEET